MVKNVSKIEKQIKRKKEQIRKIKLSVKSRTEKIEADMDDLVMDLHDATGE